ncbi:MAG: hypothetical protein Fur003_2920 [Candidatus Dojkabacteria bacterium]
MNLLYFSTLHILSAVDGRIPQSLYRVDVSLLAHQGGLEKYREELLGYFDQESYDNPIIGKVMICLHFLETLRDLEEKHNGFDCIFSETPNDPNSFLAGIFYQDFSISSKEQIIPDKVDEEEFALFLATQVLKYIPESKRDEGEFGWLPIDKAVEALNTSNE